MKFDLCKFEVQIEPKCSLCFHNLSIKFKLFRNQFGMSCICLWAQPYVTTCNHIVIVNNRRALRMWLTAATYGAGCTICHHLQPYVAMCNHIQPCVTAVADLVVPMAIFFAIGMTIFLQTFVNTYLQLTSFKLLLLVYATKQCIWKMLETCSESVLLHCITLDVFNDCSYFGIQLADVNSWSIIMMGQNVELVKDNYK